MSCVNSSCCCCHGNCHPVSSSQKAVCAAANATVGTDDTINALIVNGSHVLTALDCNITQTKATAVKAQTQIATSAIYAGALIVVGFLGLVAFFWWAGKRNA